MLRCKHCGMSEDEHHTFEPFTMPDGCVCDPNTWDSIKVREPCEKFDGDAGMYCRTCEHDEACHRSR